MTSEIKTTLKQFQFQSLKMNVGAIRLFNFYSNECKIQASKLLNHFNKNVSYFTYYIVHTNKEIYDLYL